MPWSGGTYTRTGGSTNWRNDRDASIQVEASLHDTHDEDLADGINQCIEKGGSNSFTGNANLGNNRITNVADPTGAQDAATKQYVDDAQSLQFRADDEILIRPSNATGVPAGWTTVAIGNKAIRIDQTATHTTADGGTVAFDTAFSTARATTTEGSHTHGSGSLSTGATGSTIQYGGSTFTVPTAGHTHPITGTTGSGSNHSHTSNINVQYKSFRVIRKS